MRDFRKYNAWQESHLFTLEVYQVTKDFPKEELFGLTSQLRRALSSIPTNLHIKTKIKLTAKYNIRSRLKAQSR